MFPRIESIWPGAALPGGVIQIDGNGFSGKGYSRPAVRFGTLRSRLLVAGERLIIAEVPESSTRGYVSVETQNGCSEPALFFLGERLAKDVHPVANPAIDSKGNIFTTFSGPRGKEVPVSIFKIRASDGKVEPFLSGIVNATGLAFLPDDTLLVSSRHDGTVYAVSPSAEIEVFAEGMGVATGLAVDQDQSVYVGDRTGTVFKIDRSRQIFVFSTIEPSVAAFHLAISAANGNLYLCAPTTSSCERIQRIDQTGQVERHWHCFGRPQGVAFDSRNRLYVCASFDGRRGIFRISGIDSKDGAERLVPLVSGQGIVGIALEPDDSLIVATASSIYRFPPIP